MTSRGMRAPEWALAVALALAALVVRRPCGLGEPYWWDAGAVYAPGAKWLADHGFDARPGVFPSDLSRGHTSLFYLLTAGAFRAFGASPAVGHALVLGFAAMALAYTYALGKWLFGRAAGVTAAALLVATPLFLTMASETLPEVPITALAVASLYAFARGRRWESAAWGVALVLVKETGVAVPLALAGALALRAWRTKDYREGARAVGRALVPVAVLAAFFLWQKLAEGWFVLPYHADLFHERHSLWGQFLRVTRSIVVTDGRAWVLAAALAVAAWRAHRERAVFDAPPPEGGLDRPTVLAALALVALANVVFFTKMFFLERYALPAHPGLLVIAAGVLCPASLRGASRAHAAGAVAVVAALVLAVAARWSPGDYASGELSFRYLHAVRAHQAMWRHLEARPARPVILTTWPMTDELRHPFLGWVSRPFRAVSLGWYRAHGHDPRDGGPIAAVVTFDAVGEHRALQDEAQRLGFRVTRRERVGGATIELWE